jgi:hypothetical protein
LFFICQVSSKLFYSEFYQGEEKEEEKVFVGTRNGGTRTKLFDLKK